MAQQKLPGSDWLRNSDGHERQREICRGGRDAAALNPGGKSLGVKRMPPAVLGLRKITVAPRLNMRNPRHAVLTSVPYNSPAGKAQDAASGQSG